MFWARSPNLFSDDHRTATGSGYKELSLALGPAANMTPANQTAHPPAALRNSGRNCESEDYTLIGELILQSRGAKRALRRMVIVLVTVR